MLKKRIAAAIVVKNNRAVQSFGYRNYLPLGSVTTIIENLDRWSVDEIIVLDIDRSRNKIGPNLSLLKKVSSIPISTSLTYAGGITTVQDGLDVVDSGAERVIVDNLFLNNHKEIKSLSEAIGSQALIVSMPIKIIGNIPYHFDYIKNDVLEIDLEKLGNMKKFISEVMLIDVASEGVEGLFNSSLVELFSDIDLRLICYGGVGVSDKGSMLLNNEQVNAIAYGNILNYGELAFQKIKKSLKKSKKKLRRSIYRDLI